ncbi:MAG: single-stranded-DNA-specific exonuclease RecJ [Clostridiales bacterium]|nr:single-stranded-DNA-specific exonuclease RecJ [Clostridiales bacterium]
MTKKLWKVSAYDKNIAADLADECGIDPFAALLATARGLTKPEDIADFFEDSLDNLEDPFNLPDMDKAVSRIEEAITKGEKIMIFGDYDADGITATAMLQMYLEAQGALVESYIPDRITEGYGLNFESTQAIIDAGVDLLITVDNGISAIEEAAFLAENGVEMIITDHHKPMEELPGAVAVVDPHREDSKTIFKEYSGVGVVFNLICAVEGGVEEFLFEEFGDLLAIGTVGDVVPLVAQNRTLVRAGLQALNRNKRVGIAALLKVAEVEKNFLNSRDLAFSLVPRINAVGRLGCPKRALDLLLTDDEAEAQRLASEIEEDNKRRKEIENEISDQIKKMIRENPTIVYDRVMVISGEGWQTGVLGILASRLAEKYGRPCLVMSQEGDQARGSGRSIEGFSLFDALNAVSDCLSHFGGHTLAAGFALPVKDIDLFRRQINEYAASVEMPFQVEEIDIKLNPGAVSLDLLEALEMFEPVGAGNPGAVFGLFGVKISGITPLSQGRHTKIKVERAGMALDALIFNKTRECFEYDLGDKVDLAVELSLNVFRNVKSVTVRVKNIRLSMMDDLKLLSSIRLYERFTRGESLEPSQANSIYPKRELFVSLYRYLASREGQAVNLVKLCSDLGDEGEMFAALKLALDALVELELVSVENDCFVSLHREKEKVELQNAPSLKRLVKFL